jgi:hypothetical protein
MESPVSPLTATPTAVASASPVSPEFDVAVALPVLPERAEPETVCPLPFSPQPQPSSLRPKTKLKTLAESPDSASDSATESPVSEEASGLASTSPESPVSPDSTYGAAIESPESASTSAEDSESA